MLNMEGFKLYDKFKL